MSYMVVEATPENAARISDGHQIDSVNDLAMIQEGGEV